MQAPSAPPAMHESDQPVVLAVVSTTKTEADRRPLTGWLIFYRRSCLNQIRIARAVALSRFFDHHRLVDERDWDLGFE
jgi:hypothetical protein